MNYLQLIVASAIAATLSVSTSELAFAKPLAQGADHKALSKNRPAKTVKEWLAQVEAAPAQVNGVKVDRTDTGIDITLETADGKQLQVDASRFRAEGNALIADIPNAVLALPNAQAFSADRPAGDIATVRVVQQDASSIRISVVGTNALPRTDVTLKTGGLAYSLNPEAEGEDEEIVVTGEGQRGYRVPNATTATKTDTPLRDIPQSIQVVPQELLRDRQSQRIQEALQTVSGVVPITSPAGSRNGFVIRGFADFSGFLVNGIPDPQISSDGSFTNVDRIEVLKGPASVLYGEGPVGGIINLVTKQALREPFYEVTGTFGSFSDYRGAIDFSGPLNADKTVLYRFNASYRNFGSFLDFDEGQAISIAPNLAIRLGANTNLVVEGDVNFLSRNGQQPEGQPARGTVLPNPNGRISRSFNAQGPQTDNYTVNGRAGYRFEHRFNDEWKLRNAFLYTFYDDDDRDGAPGIFNDSLAANNRTLNRRYFIGSQFYDSYYLDTNLLGNFRTGSIQHQLLIGFSLDRDTTDLNFEFGNARPVDIFNPIFNQTVVPTGIRTTNSITTRDTLGIYLQDQIALTDNLKFLVGGRLDIFTESATNRFANTSRSQSDTAFSPRVGIVYQPIPSISLYASYAQSFIPTIGTSANGDPFSPGRGTQYEIGIKGDITNRLSATFALYDLTRTNVTTTDPDNPFFSVQTGEQKSQGIELDVSGEILPGWNIFAGYAYTDAKVTADNTIRVGNRLRSAPEHSFSLWTTYKIQRGDLQGLGFGLGLFYVGDRQGDLANTFALPSYLRTDAAIFYERDRFRASLNIENLFDIDYFATARSIVRVDYGAPLSIRASLSWRF